MCLHKIQAVKHILFKKFLFQYMLIGRGHHKTGFGIPLHHMKSSPCHRRQSGETHRLSQNLSFIQFWQLFLHQLLILPKRRNNDIFLRNETDKAVISELQQRTPHPEKIKKLFRESLPARRPKAPADTAGQNDAITIFIVLFHAVITIYKVTFYLYRVLRLSY